MASIISRSAALSAAISFSITAMDSSVPVTFSSSSFMSSEFVSTLKEVLYWFLYPYWQFMENSGGRFTGKLIHSNFLSETIYDM